MGAFDGWVPLTVEVVAKDAAGTLLAAATSVVEAEVRADGLEAVFRQWASESEPEFERVVPLGDGFRVVLATRNRELSSDAPAVDALGRAILWSRLRSTGVVSVRAWGEAVIRNSAAAQGIEPAVKSIRKAKWGRIEVVARTADGHEWVACLDPTGARPPEASRTSKAF